MSRTAVVVNLKGGTAMGMSRENVSRVVRERIGERVNLVYANGDDLPEVMTEAFEDADYDRIIVAGGDGTASLAGQLAVKTDKPFGIVPLGTMNLFARTIGMPLDVEEALSALADPEIRGVDCGEANGVVFVNHVSLGFHPHLVRMRDAIPRGSRLKRMWNGARIYARLVSNHRRLRLDLTGDFAPFGTKAGLAVVSVNAIKEGTAQIPHPDGQTDGKLGLYISTHKSAWDLNKVVWRLLNGTLRESEHISFRSTREVSIHSDSAMHISIDGEVSISPEPIHCRILPGRLKVLVPRMSAEAD